MTNAKPKCFAGTKSWYDVVEKKAQLPVYKQYLKALPDAVLQNNTVSLPPSIFDFSIHKVFDGNSRTNGSLVDKFVYPHSILTLANQALPDLSLSIPFTDYKTKEEKWLKRNFDELFTEQLHLWYTDESMWPQKRSFTLFGEWFSYSHSLHTMIFDTQKGFIEKI